MRLSKIFFSVTFLVALSACGAETETTDAGAPEAKSSPAKTISVENGMNSPTSGSSLSENPTLDDKAQLLKRGRIVWFKCRSCHELKEGAPNKVGPNLYGLFGSNAGLNEDFKYSEALLNAGIVWDDISLDGFVTRPSEYLPGTRMAFVGVKKEYDRKALIAYMKQELDVSE